MAKKLDNTNTDGKKKQVENPNFAGMELDEDLDTSGMDESDLEIDEEGNFVSDLGEEIETDKSADKSDEDSEDGEDETEEYKTAEPDQTEDEDEEEDEVPEVEPVQKKKKLSPIEIKLIATIKENKELRRNSIAKVEAKKSAELVKSYLAEGHDEDTAKRYASQDIETQRLQTEVELLRFERNNAKVFEKYPQAAERTDDIMRKAKAAGMTAEEVCRGIYGKPVLAREERAMRAARGESTRVVEPTGSNATRAATADTNKGLSATEIAFKRELERRFNGGKAMDLEEFRKYRKG